MKKIELQHLIREMIREGVMDNMATQLSRMIITHLKKSVSNSIIHPFVAKDENLKVQVNFERGDEKLRHVGGKYDFLARKIIINIAVPHEFDERELTEFIPNLKDVLRHELEHFRQDQRSGYKDAASGTHYTDPDSNSVRYALKGKNPFLGLDTTWAYFTTPHEVEAFVMGTYKMAKTMKKPLDALLRQKTAWISGALQRVGKFSEEESEKVSQDILRAWLQYAGKRIPGKQPPTP